MMWKCVLVFVVFGIVGNWLLFSNPCASAVWR